MCLITANYRVCETPVEEIPPGSEGMQGLLWNIYHRSDGMLLDGGWYEDTPEGALEVALGSELFTLEMMDEAWIEEIRSALICGETYTVGGETRTCTLPHHTDTDPLHG